MTHEKKEDKKLNLSEFSFETVKVNRKGKVIKREQKTARYYREDLGNGINLDMVYIQGGTFIMGSPDTEGHSDEKPQHQVTIPSFFISKYLVTEAQWNAVVPYMGKRFTHEHFMGITFDYRKVKGNNYPVTGCCWDGILEFCSALSKLTGTSYSVPKESQWEYSCRAGTTTPFYCGETITTDLANYNGNYTYADEPKGQSGKGTTPVGSFPPNDWGLYDMHGNVSEWCPNTYYPSYDANPNEYYIWRNIHSDDPQVMRGGSCYHKPDDCRCASRHCNETHDGVSGFRVMSIVL